MIDKKMKNKLSLNKQLKEALKYIYECREQIYVIIALFFVSSILGFIFSEKLGFIEMYLREILLKVEGLDGFELTFFILQNNVQSAFFSMIFGVFLGLSAIFNTIGNGVVLGYVSSLVVREGSVVDLWRLLPHGVFELLGVFISLGLGLKLAGFAFVRYGRKLKELKRRFYNSINVFLFVVLPLLILAAIIEGVLIAFFG